MKQKEIGKVPGIKEGSDKGKTRWKERNREMCGLFKSNTYPI